MVNRSDWPWPDDLDGVRAAPESHLVLVENEAVRTLEVVIPPGHREPLHTHRWPSVMIVDRPARIRYYGSHGDLEFESPPHLEGPGPAEAALRVEWLEAEGPHSVENVDDVLYHAIRVELKGR